MEEEADEMEEDGEAPASQVTFNAVCACSACRHVQLRSCN